MCICACIWQTRGEVPVNGAVAHSCNRCIRAGSERDKPKDGEKRRAAGVPDRERERNIGGRSKERERESDTRSSREMVLLCWLCIDCCAAPPPPPSLATISLSLCLSFPLLSCFAIPAARTPAWPPVMSVRSLRNHQDPRSSLRHVSLPSKRSDERRVRL